MRLIDVHKASRNTFELDKGYQPYSSVFYILKGSFKINIYNKWISIKKGDVIYLPSTLYFEREIIDPIEFYYLRIEEDDAYFPYGGVLKIDDMAYFESTLRYILQAYNSKGMQKVCNIMLESMFCPCLLFSDNNNIDIQIEKCMAYITEHFCEDTSLDFLCSLAGWSKTVLIEKFRKSYKTTPTCYINRLRIEKAKDYLAHTRLSVTEIAFSCGFHCPYYFSNIFKKHCGESPLQYRKNARV